MWEGLRSARSVKLFLFEVRHADLNRPNTQSRVCDAKRNRETAEGGSISTASGVSFDRKGIVKPLIL
jgi:hypothetical protein